MDITLANVADYSNAISIAVIICCFIGMAVFILRLNLNDKVNMQPGDIVPGRMMRGVHNPYTLQLVQDRVSTLKDGVWLDLRCQSPCVVQALWGVSIADVYPAIYLDWDNYSQQIISDTWLEESVTYRGDPIKCEPQEQVRLKIEVPSGVDLHLGDVPRAKYPLVIALLTDAMETEVSNNDHFVASVVSLFHLQDEACPGKSHIITQYIRTPTGSPCQLQQLFVASADDSDISPPDNRPSQAANDSSIPTEELDADPSRGNCIVCQSQSINRALLPCRHVCVCDHCFLRLDKCPMCRSGIESYFQLTPSSEPNRSSVEHSEAEPRPWWDVWNDRLNEYLGFR